MKAAWFNQRIMSELITAKKGTTILQWNKTANFCTQVVHIKQNVYTTKLCVKVYEYCTDPVMSVLY